jgi:hypothetical protein
MDECYGCSREFGGWSTRCKHTLKNGKEIILCVDCDDDFKDGSLHKKQNRTIHKKRKKPTKAELKEYKRHLKAGFGEYLLTQGGKMGILFAGLMFLFDYFGVFGEDVQGVGMYIFLGIFFGLFMALFGWYSMKKAIGEHKGGK